MADKSLDLFRRRVEATTEEERVEVEAEAADWAWAREAADAAEASAWLALVREPGGSRRPRVGPAVIPPIFDT